MGDWDSSYEKVGDGYCKDDAGEYYEGWYAVGWNLGKLVHNGDGVCSCQECEDLCNEHQRCVGCQYYCCEEGVRCFGGASVLFSYGSRPLDAPPSPFSWVGPKGSAITGDKFIATGEITKIHNSSGATCYKKPSYSPSAVV